MKTIGPLGLQSRILLQLFYYPLRPTAKASERKIFSTYILKPYFTMKMDNLSQPSNTRESLAPNLITLKSITFRKGAKKNAIKYNSSKANGFPTNKHDNILLLYLIL
jgi:hypothetical protein